jgi:hypothetical protein
VTFQPYTGAHQGEMKLVDARELQSCTSDGWQLVGTVQVAQAVPLAHVTPMQGYAGVSIEDNSFNLIVTAARQHSYGHGGQITSYNEQLAERTLFLICKPEKNLLAERNEAWRKAVEREHQALKRVRELEALLDEGQKAKLIINEEVPEEMFEFRKEEPVVAVNEPEMTQCSCGRFMATAAGPCCDACQLRQRVR